MVFKRRMRLLVCGFLGSISVGAVLVISCLQITTVPVVATVCVEFPLSLEGTPLTIKGITGYEGPYVEDGTDEEVVDIAAISVVNTGQKIVRRACIRLIGEQGDMCFLLTQLLPGETAVVLEQSRQPWVRQQFLHGKADCEESVLQELQVQVNVSPEGLLEISNPTDAPIRNIILMHKTWSDIIGAYLGGITYETKIDEMQPGQLLLIRPAHFAPGISRIVAVTADGQ